MSRTAEEVAQLEKFLDRPNWARHYNPALAMWEHVVGAVGQAAVAGVGYMAPLVLYRWLVLDWNGQSNTWNDNTAFLYCVASGFTWLIIALFYYVVVAHIIYKPPPGALRNYDRYEGRESFPLKYPHRAYHEDFDAEEKQLARPVYLELLGATHEDDLYIVQEQWQKTVQLLENRRTKKRELKRLQPTDSSVNISLIEDHNKELDRQIAEAKKAELLA